MTEKIFLVTVPQLGVNDTVAVLVEWYLDNEAYIKSGDPLCALETSKAVFDVEAESSGYLMHLAKEGDEVSTSQPIALIGLNLEDIKSERECFHKGKSHLFVTTDNSEFSPQATLKAQKMAQELCVNLAEIESNGIVREQDVQDHYQKKKMLSPLAPQLFTWDSKRTPVMIYGAGKGGQTVKECLDLANAYQPICFVDDASNLPERISGIPVYHGSRLNEIRECGIDNLMCAIGNGQVRLRIMERCEKLGLTLINAIHPNAYVSPTAKLGVGNHIKAGAVVDTNSKIGNGCIIDNGVIIAHDNIIDNGCHLAPGVVLGSSINVGDLSIIGIGSSLATGVTIGKSVIISVGSSVIRDVPDYSVIEGVPGKLVGKRKRASDQLKG